jgi:putative transcriptional regulator
MTRCGIHRIACFQQRLFDLAGESTEVVLRQIQADVLLAPARGDVVPGLAGIRKARCPDPVRGSGKRGGLRYLYLYLAHQQHIHLLFLLAKSEQEDATRDEKAALWRLVADLKGSDKPEEMMSKRTKINIYDDVRRSLVHAIAYERGQQIDLRVTEIPRPPRPLKPTEIREIRERLNASQAVFARFLCVSVKAVQSWEQGSRRPQRTALRLLRIARKNPKVLLLA